VRMVASDEPRRTGYVLIAVLIVIVVLTLAAYRYSDMMFSEFKATDRILKNVEARRLPIRAFTTRPPFSPIPTD